MGEMLITVPVLRNIENAVSKEIRRDTGCSCSWTARRLDAFEVGKSKDKEFE